MTDVVGVLNVVLPAVMIFLAGVACGLLLAIRIVIKGATND